MSLKRPASLGAGGPCRLGLFLACLFSSVPLMTGCFGHTESLIVQDQRVDSGRREFDSYFEEVDDLRDQVEQLDSDMFAVRERLVEELDVSPDIALGTLLEKTRKRVEKAKGYGTALTLTLSPRPRIIVIAGEAGDERDDRFGTAVEQSAEKALDKFKAYTELLELASALDSRRNELAERIDKLPKQYQDKRDLLETEIVGAGEVLRDVRVSSCATPEPLPRRCRGGVRSKEQACFTAAAEQGASACSPLQRAAQCVAARAFTPLQSAAESHDCATQERPRDNSAPPAHTPRRSDDE